MRIPKDDVCAVVIDMQERLFPHIEENIGLESTLVTLLRGLQELNVETLVTQQYTKGLGPTIMAVTETLNDFSHIEKICFSCCGEPQFMEKLRANGARHIILTGIEAHVCVQQTALDLRAEGYTPVIIEDCVSSRRHRDKDTAIERMRAAGCIITSCESILFELLVEAGSDTFRAISRLVK